MKTFVVELHYNVNRQGREGTNPAHAAYLKALADEGKLLLAGPVTGQNIGLLIYDLPDENALQKVLAGEPYIRAGLVSETVIKTWAPGKGYLTEALNVSRKHLLASGPSPVLGTSQGAKI